MRLDDDDDRGFFKMVCSDCKWHGWTDSGVCNYCKPCRVCGEVDMEEFGGDPCVCILEDREEEFRQSGAPPF
jgi:hypothetical protein